MTLQQLEYIVAVSQYGHFVKAANACGITQSTLSLMVKKLEEELDAKIFNRNTYPVTMTEMGKLIVAKAKDILYNRDQLLELTKSQEELSSGPLRIGLISTVSPIITPALFIYFKENFPNVLLSAEEMSTANIKKKLHRAEIDMGIIASPINDSELLEIPLFHEKFYAYLSPKDPSYSKDSIEYNDLVNHKIWVIQDGMRLLDIGTFKHQPYESLYEGGRVGIMIQLVNENGGITIVPEIHTHLIMYSQQKNLRPIVKPSPERTISLVFRKDFIHEKLMNAVIAAVRTCIPYELLEDMAKKEYLHL